MAPFEVLLAGATGYIGGTVLSQISTSKNEPLNNCNLTLLVRGEDKARVFEEKGFKTELFESLHDTKEVESIAGNYDLIINITPGGSVHSATAFIKGLGNRQKSTGRDVYYTHTSGTSNLADQPITNAYHESRTFTDTSPTLYPYLLSRNSLAPYPQRTTDIAVIETGLASSVKTYIIMPPTIYGTGLGLFNRLTIQAPTVMRSALRTGEVMQLGADDGDVEHVHVEDLANLYTLMANWVVKDGMQGFPSGERGIYFAGTGRYTWGEFSRGIAKALFEVGGVKTENVRRVGLKEAAKNWTGGDELLCELNFGSKYADLLLLNPEERGRLVLTMRCSFRTRPDTSRSLGWQPQKTKKDFDEHYLETAKLVMES